MFAKTTNVGFAQRVVATLVASAVLLWSFGAYVSTAQAVNLRDVSNTLSTSNPGVTSAHQIVFYMPDDIDGLASGDDITIAFPSAAGQFVGADIAAGTFGTGVDVEINDGAVAHTHVSQEAVGDEHSFTFELGAVATSGDKVAVLIDDGIITNPASSSQSYEIVITLENGYEGKTRVAIVDTVLVTAIVETTFDFVIEGLGTGTDMYPSNDAGLTLMSTTTGSSTPTALDFDVLSADVQETLGQRLNVTTNAREGFVVTVQSDGEFESANGAIIDSFNDGGDVSDTGTPWAAPGDDIDDETTWGHWGLITNDSDLVEKTIGGYGEEFGTSTSYIAASTTPRVVFHHDGPADGDTANKGESLVFYRVEITSFQEAADDYETTLTYIATPTF